MLTSTPFLQNAPFVCVVFRDSAAHYRDACFVNALGPARNQWVPGRQLIAIRYQTVRTGSWQPVEGLRLIQCQCQALRNLLRPFRIICTTTVREIKKPACDICVKNFPAVLVLYFVHTTQGATVTQRLPFDVRHLGQGFAFPKLILHRPTLCTTKHRFAI